MVIFMKWPVHLMWCEACWKCVCTSLPGASMVWYFEHKVQEVAYTSACVAKVVCSQVCICCGNDMQ